MNPRLKKINCGICGFIIAYCDERDHPGKMDYIWCPECTKEAEE